MPKQSIKRKNVKPKGSTQRSFNDRLDTSVLKRMPVLAVAIILLGVCSLIAYRFVSDKGESKAATIIRDLTHIGNGGILPESGYRGYVLTGQAGPSGDPVIRNTLLDGNTGASAAAPNERSDAQGGGVPINGVRWIAGWERITELPANMPNGASWRWQLMGFWEIHGQTLPQATVQPEIWRDNGQYRRRLNTNAGSSTHRYFDLWPITFNRWDYVEIGVNYRNDSNGWIEVYRNGSLVKRVSGPMTGESVSGYWKIANYRTETLSGAGTYDMSGVRVWDSRPPLPAQVGGTTTTPPPVTTPPPTTTPPTTTPPPVTNPNPTPTPTPTPTGGTLPSNEWGKWVWRMGGGSVAMTHANSGSLLTQFNSYTNGYGGEQYGYYCLTVPTTVTAPKSITFTATFNPKTANMVYFYAGDSSNKLWKVSDTGGVATTQTVTVALQGQRNLCFGNVTNSKIVGNYYSANRYLKVTNYTIK